MRDGKRNGTIDLFRIVFCLVVLIYHFSLDIYGTDWRDPLWGGIMRYGALSVEFFFIVSGYFMAKSVSRRNNKSDNIIGETGSFICGKLKSILPYHICFNLMTFLIGLFRGHSFEESVNRLSCLFFLPTVGFNDQEWMLGAEWYIGYMLFAMLIIYPFVRQFKTTMMKYVAPISSVVLYGYLSQQYHTVMGSNRMIESFAGILLGITVYSISEFVKEKTEKIENSIIVWCMRLYPVAAIGAFILYMNTSLSTEIQPVLVLFLASGLAVTFAEQGLVSHTPILNNKFVYWLGQISLPIYLIQNITRMVVLTLMNNQPTIIMYIAEGVVTIVCGIIACYIVEKLLHSRKLAKYQ